MQTDSASTVSIKRTWQQDFLASIVVFLVALPLCMGIAIASGAPASAGLVGGVIGGLVVGALGGCPLQVSGPAAGLATVMYDAILRHGLEQLGLIVMIAGIMQLAGGWLGIGKWFRAVSPAVIRGMLGGIGVLIFASQFHVMLDDVPHGSGIRDLMTIPQAVQKAAHWPTASTRDVRHDQRMILQELGELHRQQVNLNEQVAEQVPHHLSRPTSEQGPMLEKFVPEQQEILESLSGVLARAVELFPDQNEKRKRFDELSMRALRVEQVCVNDLQEEQWAFVVAAQEEAATALEDLQGVFKNHEIAAGVGVLAILVLLSWSHWARGRLKVIPAPLMAVAVATLVTFWGQLPILYVEVPDSLWEEMHILRWSSLQHVEWQGILVTAATVAVLASAQTLLTATAVDQLHHGERTNYDRELSAQGVGNVLCGMVGGLPLAGVIVRSTANIEAGAHSRLSAILHGLWMLLIVAFLGVWLRMIPTSALAAILVYTGYRLVDWKSVKLFLQYGRGEVVVYLVTLVTVVAVDLLVGVVTGFLCSLILLAYRFSRLRVRMEGPDERDQYTVRLEGAATFLKLPKLASVLEKLPPGRTVELNVRRLHFIDQACLENLQSWAGQYESGGGDVVANWAQLESWAHQSAPQSHAHRSVKSAASTGEGALDRNEPRTISEPELSGLK